jgi:SAM-dependent methyltransferase
MGKVLVALRALRLSGIETKGWEIFDYGFGAGTLFHYCHRSASLFGVEIDPVNVEATAEVLGRKGFNQVDLRVIEIEKWKEHPLLKRVYDLFVCSHVLEHMPDPIDFLKGVVPCLKPGGSFLGLLPLNERVSDPCHAHTVSREIVERWVEHSGMRMVYYDECDPWVYWPQPIFYGEGGLRVAAQGLSLLIGSAATLAGERLWHNLGVHYSALTKSLPTQAVFLLKP